METTIANQIFKTFPENNLQSNIDLISTCNFECVKSTYEKDNYLDILTYTFKDKSKLIVKLSGQYIYSLKGE